MIELFEESVKWKILAHFLKNPTTSFYVKEIARVLDISSSSSSIAVKSLAAGGILTKEEKGQSHLYKLNAGNPIIKPLKRAYGIALIVDIHPARMFLKTDENIISLAVFGSYASGEYDEKSDIDFLVVTPSPKDKYTGLQEKLESLLGAPVEISISKPSEWRRLAERNDVFYKKVIENHVMLYGSGLE